VLQLYPQAVASVYIETGRCDLRLPAEAKLSPLAATSLPAGNSTTPKPQESVQAEGRPVESPTLTALFVLVKSLGFSEDDLRAQLKARRFPTKFKSLRPPQIATLFAHYASIRKAREGESQPASEPQEAHKPEGSQPPLTAEQQALKDSAVSYGIREDEAERIVRGYSLDHAKEMINRSIEMRRKVAQKSPLLAQVG
jgi:hypothetical protein